MGNNYQILKPLINSSKQIVDLQKLKLDDFLSKDFPNKATYDLIELMKEICQETEKFLKNLESEYESASNDDEYEEIENDLIQITQYIGWLSATAIDTIELSTRERISQDSIFLLDYFTKPFAKNAKFILNPTHEHNFMIAQWGNMFETILDLLDIKPSNLKIQPNTFSIISFPSIFKDNLVAHSSLGHEIGHFIITKYSLAEAFMTATKYDPDLIDQLTKREYSKTSSGGKKVSTLVQLGTKAKITRQIKSDVKKGIEEFVSDLIGLKILGPVFLFSSTEFLLSDTHKHFVGTEHPTPALRLQTLIDEFNSKNYLSKIPNEQKNLKESISEIIDNTKDFVKPIDISKQDLEYQIKYHAWKSVIPTLGKMIDDLFTQQIPDLEYSPESFGNDIPKLIKKLRQFIPPCEIEQAKPADLVSILNAGMIFRLIARKIIPETPPNLESTIDSLVIRAAHQSVIQNTLQEAMRKINV